MVLRAFGVSEQGRQVSARLSRPESGVGKRPNCEQRHLTWIPGMQTEIYRERQTERER